jgi:hypothetical protein
VNGPGFADEPETVFLLERPESLMLRTVLVVAVLFVVPMPLQAQIFPPLEGEIKSEYDRFTDQRKIRLSRLQIVERVRQV